MVLNLGPQLRITWGTSRTLSVGYTPDRVNQISLGMDMGFSIIRTPRVIPKCRLRLESQDNRMPIQLLTLTDIYFAFFTLVS